MLYYGFSIPDLEHAIGGPSLFDVLASNIRFSREIKVLGWFLKLDSNQRVPVNVYQLLYVSEDDSHFALTEGYQFISAYTNLRSNQSADFRIPIDGRTVAQVEYIIEDDNGYGNTCLRGHVFSRNYVDNIEHYNDDTGMFFFSANQLMTARLLMRDLASQERPPRLVFSGSSLDVGRMVSPINSDELIELDRIAASGVSDDLARWFSLKMEIISDVAPVTAGIAKEESNSVGVPMAFFAHPCPPSWHTWSIIISLLVVQMPSLFQYKSLQANMVENAEGFEQIIAQVIKKIELPKFDSKKLKRVYEMMNKNNEKATAKDEKRLEAAKIEFKKMEEE